MFGTAAGLHVGGLQEATKVVTPAPGVETAPAEVTEAALGTKLEKLRLAPAIGCPKTSVTSAAKVCVVPEATLNVVSVAPATCSEMLFGGQAITTPGVPVVLAPVGFVTVATTVVASGCLEVTTPF